MKDIIDRLNELMSILRLTQTALAKKLGISQSAVSAWIVGKNTITEQNIKAICLTFDVREEWLRNGTGEMFKPSAINISDKTFMEMYNALTPRAQKLMREYLQLLKDYEHEIYSQKTKLVFPNIVSEHRPLYRIAFFGKTAAGNPLDATAIPDEFIDIPATLIQGNPNDYFCLQILGMSMCMSNINDGDTVLIKSANFPDYNKINLVYYSNQSTLKKLSKTPDGTVFLVWDDGSDFRLPVTSSDFIVQGHFITVIKKANQE